MRRAPLAVAAAATLLTLAGCGDDDGGDASAEAYCELSAEFEAATEVPSDEQFDEMIDIAPDEIRDDVEVFVEALRTGDFEDEAAIEEAEQNLLAFEEEHCGATFGGEQEE